MKWLFLGSIAAAGLVIYARHNLYGYKFRKQLPPGELGIPLLGNPLTSLKLFHPTTDVFSEVVLKRFAIFGKVFKVYTPLLGHTVTFGGLDAVKFVQKNEERGFVVSWPTSMKNLMGPNSLMVATGDLHKHMRAAVVPAFQPAALKSYLPLIKRVVKRNLDSWTATQEGGDSYPREIVIHTEMRKLTFQIIGILTLGIREEDLSTLDEFEDLFHVWQNALLSLPFDFPWTKYGKALVAKKVLVEKLTEVVTERRSDSLTRHQDILARLMGPSRRRSTDSEYSDSKPLADDVIVDNLVTMLFAGYDTTAVTLTNVFERVVARQEVLNKLREEIKALVDSRGGGWEELSWEDLQSLKYTESVIKETMRHQPTVRGGVRQVTKDMEYNGMVIPKGWRVLYSMISLLQGEENFPNPKVFDPTRFMEQPNPEAFAPFGGGIRMCPGWQLSMLEMKAVVSYWALNFKSSPSPRATDLRNLFPFTTPADRLPILVEPASA